MPTMDTTLARVLALPALGLVQVAGRDDAGRSVRWVAVSELLDPTPYLEGGEILLTTGMNLPADDEAALAEYVGRIARRGVVALGLAVGLTHPAVPGGLIAAADAAGLPLLEVPPPTPFIAITRAVADLVAQGEREAVQRSLDAQRRLTRATLRPDGAASVVRELARLVGGWAMVVDAGGALLHAAPASAAGHLDTVAAEVQRIRPRGLRSTANVSAGDQTVAVFPLGTTGRPRSYLAVGTTGPGDQVVRSAVTAAVSLLSLTEEHTRTAPGVERRLRREVVRLLLDGEEQAGRVVHSALGGPALPPRLVVLAAEPRAEVTAALAEAEEDADLATSLLAACGDRLAAVVAEPDAATAAARLAVAAGRVGVSTPVKAAAAGAGWQQALQALAAAGYRDQPVVEFASLVSTGVRGLVDPAAARRWADAVLAPLRAYSEDGGSVDLVESLRTYLAHHGQWHPAAQQLGIHRHTLRYRMRRVEQLLDARLDDPQTRMDLWFALHPPPVDDHAGPPTGS
jgi:purine catabolism regulator